MYGDYDSSSGTGVIVYEDFTETGYKVEDPVLMLVGKDRVEKVVQVRKCYGSFPKNRQLIKKIIYPITLFLLSIFPAKSELQ